ncbi:hypothetical protein FDP41_004303 [Naegleria fowleri]|uniref:Uncharacterized protein n=1 Tax=Naegleria fowleri TaxID=5763 RepID=A0A6A5BQI6_NAEFO|nr:uncharacterized protein FDP41_004303 [Naegleria fowleri]KAF0976404.1 hypothetical protein FDP41_004303 [Naegleria fowleri]
MRRKTRVRPTNRFTSFKANNHSTTSPLYYFYPTFNGCWTMMILPKPHSEDGSEQKIIHDSKQFFQNTEFNEEKVVADSVGVIIKNNEEDETTDHVHHDDDIATSHFHHQNNDLTSKRELSFEEWRLIASFLSRTVAFHSLASVNMICRFAVLSCHFVQDRMCAESFVVRWMVDVKASSTCTTNTALLLPNDRLQSMLQPLHDCNLYDLNCFVHPEEKKNFQHDSYSLLPIPNYYSKTCMEYACQYGFTSLIDQLFEKPFLLTLDAAHRDHCLTIAFEHGNDDAAKRLISLSIHRLAQALETISEQKQGINLEAYTTMLTRSRHSPKAGMVIEIYAYLEEELDKALPSELADIILTGSIEEFFTRACFITLLKKNYWDSALFVLRKYISNNRNNLANRAQEAVISMFNVTFLKAFSQHHVLSTDNMLWFLNHLSKELGNYTDKPNTIISVIAHSYMLLHGDDIDHYCDYLSQYSSRDETKDAELIELSINDGILVPWNRVFRLAPPPFTALCKVLTERNDGAISALFLKQFGPCLNEYYSDELAQYFFENLIMMRHFVEHVPYLLTNQVQQRLAFLFLSQDQLDWAGIMVLIQRDSALFSEFIKTILENAKGNVLQQFCDHITAMIITTDQNVEMLNDHLGRCNDIVHSAHGQEFSITEESCDNSDRIIIFETAAVLMYCAKMGVNHLFQFITEQRKGAICNFPQVFPSIYHSITDMGNIEHVNLRREFHLVSHSTEILIFISRHSILRKYLNLLASVWSLPSSSMQQNVPSFFKSITSIHHPLDRISVLKEYSLSENDITEMISLYLSKNAMGKFINLIHLPTFTMNHLTQIPNSYLFHSNSLDTISNLRAFVDFLWNNFESDQAKLKFREFFCFIHGELYENKHLTHIMKYYKGKYLEMVEEIIYDMLLDDKYFEIISCFKSNLSSTSVSGLTDELKLEFLKKVCEGKEFEEPNFELHDFDRLKRVFQEKSNLSKHHFKSWKKIILSFTKVEEADHVSKLLDEIDPVLKQKKELKQQQLDFPIQDSETVLAEERDKKEKALSQCDLSKFNFSFSSGAFSFAPTVNLFSKFASIQREQDSNEQPPNEINITPFSTLNIQFKN